MVGAVLAAAGVAAGAFGAHQLRPMFEKIAESNPELAVRRQGNWETAAHYQLMHALGVLLIGVLLSIRPHRLLVISAWLLTLGTIIFSGMLYLLVLLDLPILGAIVPLGGISMIAGWGSLAAAGWSLGRTSAKV